MHGNILYKGALRILADREIKADLPQMFEARRNRTLRYLRKLPAGTTIGFLRFMVGTAPPSNNKGEIMGFVRFVHMFVTIEVRGCGI